CASNKAAGAPALSEGLVAAETVTGTAICFPSAARENNSLPSPRQRGSAPPAVEILNSLSADGKGCTYTSGCPVLSEAYAIQPLSGESWPCASLNAECTNGIGAPDAFPSGPMGSTQTSHLVFGS